MAAIIELADVHHAYAQYRQEGEDVVRTPAIQGVTLSIEEGSFMAVVGHNGSGKSTLAKHMNALLLPDRGTVTVAGMSTADESRLWDIRQTVGMVFQNPDNQIVSSIVEEDVAFGLENLGVPREQIRPRVEAALDAVGMSGHALKAPHMLSGGQKQRVAIAGVIAMRPRVIVFDESTAMLDPAGRAEVLDTAVRLNHDEGITVIWITHFIEECMAAGRVVVMSGGTVDMDGPPLMVLRERATLRGLGLTAPPMLELSGRLREAGVPLAGDPSTLEQMAEALCPLLSKN